MDGDWNGLERRRLALEALEARVKELEAYRASIARTRRRRLWTVIGLAAGTGTAVALAFHLIIGW